MTSEIRDVDLLTQSETAELAMVVGHRLLLKLLPAAIFISRIGTKERGQSKKHITNQDIDALGD